MQHCWTGRPCGQSAVMRTILVDWLVLIIKGLEPVLFFLPSCLLPKNDTARWSLQNASTLVLEFLTPGTMRNTLLFSFDKVFSSRYNVLHERDKDEAVLRTHIHVHSNCWAIFWSFVHMLSQVVIAAVCKYLIFLSLMFYK